MRLILPFCLLANLLVANDLPYRTENALDGLTFSQPLGLAHAPNDRDTLYVLEKTGIIMAVRGLSSGKPSKQPFLDLTQPRDGKLETSSECGVLGLAFHPNYERNRHLFVFYSLKVGGKLHQRISRFTAASDGRSADPASEVVFISQPDPAANHNGGDLHFGPDGMLYIACGDGGAADDRFDTSRRIDGGFFSAVYRIDVDQRPGGLKPNPHEAVIRGADGEAHYLIPADNPFLRTRHHRGEEVKMANLRGETWATGLRNAWRISYDAQTRRWFTGDVGQNEIEEVDILVPGGDYGWSVREGSKTFGRAKGVVGRGRIIDPIFQYGRDLGASITGGLIYRGKAQPELTGAYIYGDFASGRIFALREQSGRWQNQTLAKDGSVASFGFNPANGDLLFCNMGGGTVRRLVVRK